MEKKIREMLQSMLVAGTNSKWKYELLLYLCAFSKHSINGSVKYI